MPQRSLTRNLVGLQVTAGAAEETVNLSVNGAVAAATVPVAANTVLTLTDTILSGDAITEFRLQQTTDGTTFFNIIPLIHVAATTNVTNTLTTPLQIIGGVDVAIRARARTPGGAADVAVLIQGILND